MINTVLIILNILLTLICSVLLYNSIAREDEILSDIQKIKEDFGISFIGDNKKGGK